MELTLYVQMGNCLIACFFDLIIKYCSVCFYLFIYFIIFNFRCGGFCCCETKILLPATSSFLWLRGFTAKCENIYI